MADTPTYRERVAAWLEDQGHAATVESNGERYASVHFRARGASFTVRVDEGDHRFFFLSHGWNLPAGLQKGPAVVAIARDVEHSLKVVKIVLDWDGRGVQFNAEQFVPDGGPAAIFWRCVDVLVEAAARFFSAVGDLRVNAAAQRFIDDVGRDLGLAPGEQR
jgi:hypothetical protein